MSERQPVGQAFAIHEKIELLPVKLLDQQRPMVEALKRFARSLGLEFGWHYLLDLTWILVQLGAVKGQRVMDAGAGTGILQWYLAEQGAEVISVDRSSRADLPVSFRARFKVRGLRESDLHSSRTVLLKHFSQQMDGPFYRRWASKLYHFGKDLINIARRPQGPGSVLIYNQDLSDLSDIPDNSLDAVVSVSALEHNTPTGLEKVVAEIMRKLKPNGVLLATLTAGRDQDVWHEPSSGMCYTDSSLRRLFDLNPDVPSNYARYDELFAALVNCAELRDHLASFYFKSDKNGMPWGKWDPQYQPVGVCKIKRGSSPSNAGALERG
jgi:SAM-dependent methyltransferase